MYCKYTYISMDNLDSPPNKVALVERNIAPQGIPLIDPQAVVKSSRKDLIALATEIQKADNYIKSNACNKLQMIAQQMKFLQKQAENVLLEAQQNVKLHHAACNFIKQPGHVYHLYQRESGQFYFSMLSPEEWGSSGPPQSYEGSFRLEQDHSWTPLTEVCSKDNELGMFNKLFTSNVSTNSVFKTIGLDIDT